MKINTGNIAEGGDSGTSAIFIDSLGYTIGHPFNKVKLYKTTPSNIRIDRFSIILQLA